MIDAQELSSSVNEEQKAPKPASPAQPSYVPAGYPRKDFSREDARYKSPAFAALLSLMPGLGQVYVGYYFQGFINIMIIASLITLLARGVGHLEPFCGLFLAFYWMFNLVDAARRAAFYNQAVAGLGPAELPAGVGFPDRRGPLYGGILMVVVGTAAFANIRFGMRFDWIERWWPLALIILGAFLIYRSMNDLKKTGQ
jgi:hypothetical protein